MRLRSFEIGTFKSIRNSGEVAVGDVVCLLGRNESGKTALLEALYRLNPGNPGETLFDVDRDYPKSMVEEYLLYMNEHGSEHDEVVRATFDLSPDNLSELEAHFGSEILTEPILTLSRGYDNVLYIELSLNESALVKALIERFEWPEDLRERLQPQETFDAFVDALGEIESYKGRNTGPGVVKAIWQKGPILYFYDLFLEANVPQFYYFGEINLMPGEINLEALVERHLGGALLPSDEAILGLVKLARLELESLLDPSKTEWLNNKLEGVSERITRDVMQFWSQNRHLRLRFDVRPARAGDPKGMRKGTNLWIRIFDTRTGFSTRLGQRSQGFVWFFSFLAWLYYHRSSGKPAILLLDEPGHFLHPSAQRDMLHYLEDVLAVDHQIIYTTHSPFLVDADKPDRVRIVEDRGASSALPLPPEEDGTKVIAALTEARYDSIFIWEAAQALKNLHGGLERR